MANGNGNGYTSQQIADAIRGARGFVTATAHDLGCSRRTVYRYLKKFAGAREALEDAREKRHDFVENKLMSAIDNDNITAMIFYLKTQCKDRGYVERYQTELTGKDGGAIQGVITTIDASKLAELTDDEVSAAARAARIIAGLGSGAEE